MCQKTCFESTTTSSTPTTFTVAPAGWCRHLCALWVVQAPIPSSNRSPLTSEARQLEKQWYCQRCFDLRCETCAGCHKAIDKLREKSAVALGKAFHAEVVFIPRSKHFHVASRAFPALPLREVRCGVHGSTALRAQWKGVLRGGLHQGGRVSLSVRLPVLLTFLLT